MNEIKQVFLFGVLLLAAPVMAARFDVTADVGEIRYHEATNTFVTPWQKHVWFGLVNPSQAIPNCPTYNNYVVVSIPDGNPTAISMLLAAKMGNKRVQVTIDDTVKFPANERCKLQYLTIL